jgi:hypothetical protein
MHNPQPLGETVNVFDAETGNLRWTYPLLSEGAADSLSYCLADGILFTDDTYTCQMFAFGKGPVKIEISLPKAQVAKGEYAWITGKVLDASTAQEGTPCVAKEEMDTWMQYLHSGFPDPGPGKIGVPVMLYAENEAGTTWEIGTTTTNGDYGSFGFRWTPPEEGLYTLTAIFLGDDSYWDSYGSAVLAVGSATASVSSITSGQSNTVLSIGSIATVAAIVVGTIVIKKRPVKKMEETEQ